MGHIHSYLNSNFFALFSSSLHFYVDSSQKKSLASIRVSNINDTFMFLILFLIDILQTFAKG